MSKKKVEKIDANISKKKVSKPIMIISFVLIALVLIVVYKYCFGCLKVPIKSEFYDYEPLISDQIKVSIKDGTLSKNGMTLIIENDSADFIIRYGNAKLEPKILGVWGKLSSRKNVISTGTLYNILPGEKKELKIDWSDYHGRLSSGMYRYVFQAYTMNYRSLVEPGHNEDIDTNMYLSYEFKI